jgi:crotonobetainyl-CoA:carnitine CoA-transferase CaiB-like acyl-CoA transferase
MSTPFDRDFVVLEFASILAGPTTGQFFAGLGARVVKVENPHTGGDPTRAWRLAGEDGGGDVSTYFACANWGKESIALDLATAAGRGVAHDLARRADVVIASFKPGDAAKLGLDYPTLSALNARLVYGEISAYGGDDPRPGFDAILQAESGFTFLNGEPDGPPTKMPVALVDLLLAHHLKEGLLLALLQRAASGRGSLVTTSLLQCAVASLANQATNYLTGGVVPQRMGSEHPNIVPYGSILRCADGADVVIAAATERQYRGLMDVLGLAAIAGQPRFRSSQARVQNRAVLLALVRERAAGMAAADLARGLHAAKVPFGFVNDMAAVFRQQEARALLLSGEAGGRRVSAVRTFAASGDAMAHAMPAPPPALDAHRDDILRDLLGYDAARIAALAAAGGMGGS